MIYQLLIFSKHLILLHRHVDNITLQIYPLHGSRNLKLLRGIYRSIERTNVVHVAFENGISAVGNR